MRRIGEVGRVCRGGNRSLGSNGHHRSRQLAPQHVATEGQTDLLLEQVRKPAPSLDSGSTNTITPIAPLQSNECSASGRTMMPRLSRHALFGPQMAMRPSSAMTIWIAWCA